jgi:hypothetical protein
MTWVSNWYKNCTPRRELVRASKRRMLIMTDIKVITVTLKLDTSVVENQLRQIASELMSMADRIAEIDIQEEE